MPISLKSYYPIRRVGHLSLCIAECLVYFSMWHSTSDSPTLFDVFIPPNFCRILFHCGKYVTGGEFLIERKGQIGSKLLVVGELDVYEDKLYIELHNFNFVSTQMQSSISYTYTIFCLNTAYTKHWCQMIRLSWQTINLLLVRTT